MKAGIRVNKATRNELESIIMLDSMVPNHPNREGFLSKAVKSGGCLVAKIEDTLVGYGVVDRSFYGESFIWLLLVHPDFRLRGVATAIVGHIESVCPTEKLFTSTNESNTSSQKVFETLGFVKSGYIENLDVGDPEIVYFKRMNNSISGPWF